MAAISQTMFSDVDFQMWIFSDFREWKALYFLSSLKFVPKGPIDNNTALV